MKKPFTLLTLLVFTSCFAGLSHAEQPNIHVEKPNIVFIMLDDLGKEWISCYGADDIKTPQVDALAKNGLTFHKAWSMPQCTPTRATLLTGQYPWRTGWVNHWDVPRAGVGYFDWEKYTTFATVMKSAGYKTAVAGKWQINDFRVEPNALEKHGFDDWCMWTGVEAGNAPSKNRYWDPYIHTREGSKAYKGKFGPDIFNDFLIDFLKKNKDDPMMLYYPMALPHGPLVHTPDEMNVKDRVDMHKAMTRYADKLVGKLVSTLDDLKIRERTIVIFTTDNGTFGVRGTIDGLKPSGGKTTRYEGGVCEPFIVNCPGLVPEGKTTDALTDFSDMLPTFAELGGAKIPEGLVLDGKSIAKVILGKSESSDRDWILAMGRGMATVDEEGVRGRFDFMERAMRGDRYKVWVNTEREIDRFYDLQEDPGEKNNLIENISPELEPVLERFQTVLDSMPKVDARPKYRKRQALPWDKKPSKATKTTKKKDQKTTQK